MKSESLLVATLVLSGLGGTLPAADAVFSGPQPGEKTSPFKVVELTGPNAEKERDPIAENAGKPTTLVFVHGLERSLVPLLRVVDEYGALRKETLKSEIVFLSADRLQGEQRVKAAAGSLKLQSRVGLAIDGGEGPGNYGLNKECLMTIVVANNDTVTANFALVQPGIADAPKVLEALAKVCGDPNPPTAEQLTERQTARNGGGREGGAMRREAARGRESGAADLTKLDLNSEAGLRDAVRGLIGEVQSLRGELAALRRGTETPARGPATADKPKEDFPGAVPTDGELQGLLRRFIRPTNDDATVDKVLAEVRSHIQGNADLHHQAVDGWTRILHFDDRYGTAYARKVGREFLEQLKREAANATAPEKK